MSRYSTDKAFKSRLALLAYLICGLVLLLIDAKLRSGQDTSFRFWALNILAPIGQAIIAAVLIGAVLDRYAKSEFARAVAKEGLGHILGYDLPANIRARIQELIDQRMIRQNMRIKFTLSAVDRDLERINIRVDSEWEMVNFSYSTQAYEPLFFEEEHEKARLLYIACDYPPEAEFVTSNVELVNVNGIDMLSEADKSRVRHIAPNREPFRYRMGYQYGVTRASNGSCLFGFAGPTNRVRVEVDAPEGLFVGVAPSRTKEHFKVWEYEEAFLKDQHLTVTWRARSTSESEPKPQAQSATAS